MDFKHVYLFQVLSGTCLLGNLLQTLIMSMRRANVCVLFTCRKVTSARRVTRCGTTLTPGSVSCPGAMSCPEIMWTGPYFRHFKFLYEPKLNHINLSFSYNNFICLSMIFPVNSVWTGRCDKLQHNPLVVSFPLSNILGSMKEILSPLSATGLQCKLSACSKKFHLAS